MKIYVMGVMGNHKNVTLTLVHALTRVTAISLLLLHSYSSTFTSFCQAKKDPLEQDGKIQFKTAETVSLDLFIRINGMSNNWLNRFLISARTYYTEQK